MSEESQVIARPIAEVHATNDKHMFDLDSELCPENFWPVYKGSSFNIWHPDTGEYYETCVRWFTGEFGMDEIVP